MDQSERLLLLILTVALCKFSQAEFNVTVEAANTTVSCSPHANGSNCTGGSDVHRWSGHFSECSEEYAHYCIRGTCRFVEDQNTPSCRCENGYHGARCEYLDFSWLVQENTSILIGIIVAALVVLLLSIIFICVSVQRRKRRAKNKLNPSNEAEKLNYSPDDAVPTETSDLNTV